MKQKYHKQRRKCREFDRIDNDMKTASSKFKVGDPVVIAAENPAGNPRTPQYIRGKRGMIGAVHGLLENVRDHRGIYRPLYTVRFDLTEVSSCPDQDSIWVDVHEEWLSALQPEERN
jgi:nitrile hydratase beta subunit-like protein